MADPGGVFTGTQASGSDFVGLNEVMKTYYQEPVWENLVSDSELLDLFEVDADQQVFESNGGRWIELAHDMADGGGSGARKEGGYIPAATPPSYKNSKIFLKKNLMTTQMSSESMRRVKQGPYAFLTWIETDMKKRVRRHRHHIDRQAFGTGTGIIARVNQGTPTTSLVIDSAFGIAGRSKAAYLVKEGDYIRVGPNADGSSLRTGAAKVTGIDYDNLTITIDALPTSTTDNDYIFLGDTADNGSRKGGSTSGESDSEMMGLFGIVDSATTGVLTAFQGLTRATTPNWYGFSVDAASASSGNLSESVARILYDKIVEQGDGKPDMLLTSVSGRRNYWNTLKTDRQFVNPRGYTGGEGKLTILLDEQDLPIRTIRKCPSEVAMLIEKASLKRWQYGDGFEWDDTTGSIWRQASDATGVLDAFYAYGRFEAQLGCVLPAHNGIIYGIAAA
ncbi:MAG TPA: phage major capsid protein [Gemmatimonadaceae bacterium]|jgi:hypothetical protein